MLKTVALGPITHQPSWHWIGEGMARELAKYYRTITFPATAMPEADVVLAVKRPLRRWQCHMLQQGRTPLIYLPVDYFESEEQIRQYGEFLSKCDMILVHAESLKPFFQSFAPTFTIEHHNKFGLPDLAPFKEHGFVLWIGETSNLPYLVEYLHHHPLEFDLRLLCNFDNPRARHRALTIAHNIGVRLDFHGERANGYPLYRWSPELQAAMLLEAKAAIDIKGNDFGQQNKPPTKAQKYICSGLPVAMNACGPTRYLARLGFEVSEPTNDRWFTRRYYDETCRLALQLRPALELAAVGNQYKTVIDACTAGKEL